MTVCDRVLVIPKSKGSLLETLPVASALLQEHTLEPLYFIESKRADILLQVLAEHRLMALAPSGEPFLPAATGASFEIKRHDSPLRPRTLRQEVFRWLPEIFRLLNHYRALLKDARAILDRYPEIRALVVMGDRHVGYETAFIRAANERGIPSLILPFASSFPEAAAEPRLREEGFRRKYGVTTLGRAILASLFPRWVYRHKDQRMFFRPPVDALAAWWYGLMPQNPWTLGGGFATRMTVDSEESLAMFVRQGMDPAKMVVTGRPSADDVARTLRLADPAIIRRELGIPEGRRVILCSVPQLAEHHLLPWNRHWEEIDFLFSTMTEQDAAVVLSLHPKSDPENYQPRAEAAGALISTRRVYELLPACDIFVASYSSIVAPAIALHKPSVVVDFYDLGYPPYDGAPGVAVLRERKAFGPHLRKLLADPDFFAAQVRKQEAEGHRWAMLDGECTRRVKEELLRLVAR